MSIVTVKLSAKQCGWRRDWRGHDQTSVGCGVRLATGCTGGDKAELEFHHYPDGSVRVVFPQVIHWSADTTHSYWQLLQQVCSLAETESSVPLQCIVAAGDPAEELLTNCGFRQRDVLNTYVCVSAATAPSENRAGAKFYTASADSIIRGSPLWQCSDGPENQRQVSGLDSTGLQQLMTRILQSSQDLSWLPVPDAGKLFEMWGLIDAPVHLLTAVHQQKPAGLCVVNVRKTARVLEYIGVCPHHRRIGIGAGMIDAAFQMRTGGEPCRSMTATASEGNLQAIAFYTRYGFRETERYGVWTAARQKVPPAD